MKRLMKWLILSVTLMVTGCSNASKETEVDTTLYVQRVLDFKENYNQALSYAKDLHADEVSEVNHLKERYDSKWEWLSVLERELLDQFPEADWDEEDSNRYQRLRAIFDSKYYKELDERETDFETYLNARRSIEQTVSEEILSYLSDSYSEDYFEIDDFGDLKFSKDGFAYFLNFDIEDIESSLLNSIEPIMEYYESNELEDELNYWKEQEERIKDYFSPSDSDSIKDTYMYSYFNTVVTVELRQRLIEKMGFEQYLSFSDKDGDFDPAQAVATLMGNEYVDSDGKLSEVYSEFERTTEDYLSQQFDDLLTEEEQVFYENYIKNHYDDSKEAWLRTLRVYNEEGDYLAVMAKHYEISVDKDSVIELNIVMIIDNNSDKLQVLHKSVVFGNVGVLDFSNYYETLFE